jgi:hypothetical protein
LIFIKKYDIIYIQSERKELIIYEFLY